MKRKQYVLCALQLDSLNAQNDCLRDVLRCLQPSPNAQDPSSPRFKRLLDIKKQLEEGQPPRKADAHCEVTIKPSLPQKGKAGEIEKAAGHAQLTVSEVGRL